MGERQTEGQAFTDLSQRITKAWENLINAHLYPVYDTIDIKVSERIRNDEITPEQLRRQLDLSVDPTPIFDYLQLVVQFTAMSSSLEKRK